MVQLWNRQTPRVPARHGSGAQIAAHAKQFGTHVIDRRACGAQHAGLMSNSVNADSGQGEDGAPSFELYDLRVEVIAPPGARLLCGAKPGDWFELHGEMLYLPPGQGFSIYSLAALLLLLPAKQRPVDRFDWMYSDAEIACPDPHCPSKFKITRLGLRRFVRSDVTATAPPSTTE